MKAIISSTYDDQYLFYLPITTWLWNKLEVGVVCFMPLFDTKNQIKHMRTVLDTINIRGFDLIPIYFSAPKNKEATYAQCSRLYSGCLSLDDSEITVVSDIDMAVFKIPDYTPGWFSVFGHDLTPENQYPMCFLTASNIDWWEAFSCGEKTHQQCLDELLGHIECEDFKPNYWGRDQEEAYNKISTENPVLINRARPGTQFASNRIDRDDEFFMDRLSPDIIDYHMHRPGYAEENFEKILSVISYFYPNEDLTWMREYRNEYVNLMQ